MSFPRYPAYKDSGVEWLGFLPEHWDLVPIKRVLQSIEQGWSPQCEAATAEPGEWGVLKVGCVNGGRFKAEENKALPAELTPDERLVIRCGDVLVSRANTRELIGGVAMAERDYSNLLLCDKLYRLRVDMSLCDPAFLVRYLGGASSRCVIEMSATGASSSMLNIGQSAIINMPLALPSAAEQKALIRFLDHETAKIDALIAEQQRLIELLQEKRQAVISLAVTKGLNPDAPMKDSGVEWLGEVPEHWEVRKFAWDFTAAMGQTILKEDLEEAGLPVFSATEDDRYFGFISKPKVYLRPGDIVIPARGNCIGAVKLVKEPASATQTTIYAKKTTEAFISEYVFYCLRFSREHLFPMTRTAIPQITVGEVLSNRTCLPPPDEQRHIIDYIEALNCAFDELSLASTSAIQLLQERRSTLISVAVTGQIDVRGLTQAEVVA